MILLCYQYNKFPVHVYFSIGFWKELDKFVQVLGDTIEEVHKWFL